MGVVTEWLTAFASRRAKGRANQAKKPWLKGVIAKIGCMLSVFNPSFSRMLCVVTRGTISRDLRNA